MAYLSENASIAPKPINMQSALESFDPVIERLENLVHCASRCGDRILGSRPSEVAGNSKDTPNPNHLIFGLQSRHDRLVRAVDYLETEMQRIESGLAA